MPNPSAPFFMTTSAIVAAPTATLGGALSGTQRAGKASSKLFNESKTQQRDSLLQAINILTKGADHEEEKSGHDLYPEALRDLLDLTQAGVGSLVEKGIIAPTTLLTHIAQLPVDAKASIEALFQVVQSKRLFKTQEASTLNVADPQNPQTGLSANIRELYRQFSHSFADLDRNLKKQFEGNGVADKSHLQFATTLAKVAATLGAVTATPVALLFDTVGSVFREASALFEWSRDESINPKDQNVYQAVAKCSLSISNSKNSNDTQLALKELEQALTNFKPAHDFLDNHVATSPVVSAFLRMVTAEPFVASLIALNAASLGSKEAKQALGQEHDHFVQLSKQSAARASLIQGSSNGDAKNHSQNVTDFNQHFDAAIAHIDNDLQHMADHKLVGSSAAATIRSNSALVIGSSLVTGLFGMVSRELSGVVDFSKNDKGTKDQCAVVSQSRGDMTGADLDQLMTRVCELQERIERCNELGVSAPVAMGVSEAISCGALIASLNVLAGMYSALRELRTMAESPSAPIRLNEKEKAEAIKSAQDVVDSHQQSADKMGTAAVSQNLSLHNQLQSVMNTMVLMHRSHMNFVKPDMPRNDLDSAGKSSIVATQGNSTGFLVGSLGVLAFIALESGIGTEALFGAVRLSIAAKRLSDGVDKIKSENGSKFNASFVSNATRLTAHSSNKSTATKSTVQGIAGTAELIASRSVTVALCHSGALKEMLRRMIAEEEAKLDHVPEGNSKSAIISDRLIPNLEGEILKVLNDAEKNDNPIPGLNADMAGSLSLGSNASIASALSVHSSLIAPFLKCMVATRKASVIGDDLKNEALSQGTEASNSALILSNKIQAFTKQFVAEIQKFDPVINSTTHKSSEKAFEVSMFASCMAALLCEESFEMLVSRSLTILDRNKVDQTAQKSRENTKKEADASKAAVAEDSACGQNYSSTHVILALRLTLSHLGISLGNLASELESHPNLLQDNLKLHTVQQSVIKSMASTLSACASGMLDIASFLSASPLSTAGTVEPMRETLHSTDHTLVIKPSNSSADCTKQCHSESTVLTGMGTDSVISILISVIKLLLQGSVLGLDATLSAMKTLEILCIHPRPGQAISLETQGASQPKGTSANLDRQTQCALVAQTLSSAGFVAATKTGSSESTDHTLESLQNKVDNRIESMELLEDEEEKSEKGVLGLKSFYKLLIKLLDRGEKEELYKDLVERFNRGGITLSNYHRKFGGLNSSNKNPNALIKDGNFMGCDDAAKLLSIFVYKAYSSEGTQSPLLNTLKAEMQNFPKVSARCQNHWEYIVDSVVDRGRLERTRENFLHTKDSKLKTTDWNNRKKELLEAVYQNPAYHAPNVPEAASDSATLV